jgi:predicted DNA-binding transcriptional regulator AlpA
MAEVLRAHSVYRTRPGRKIEVKVADLVGSSEIQARCGIGANAFYRWQTRYIDFPVPITRVGRTDVWDWSDIYAWLKKKFPGTKYPRG